MLLKCSTAERKAAISSKGNGSLARGTAMRMTMATASTMTPRIHRKGFRTPSKRHPGKVLPGKLHSISRVGPGKIAPGKRINPRPHPPPCDNSNDSGFGFDQHVEVQQQMIRSIPTASRSIPLDEEDSSNDIDDVTTNIRMKRRKVENIQIETDDACSNDAFVQKIATTTAAAINNTSNTATKYISTIARNNVRPALKRPVIPAQTNISTTSKNGIVQLQIISQPETQHRARYQTEGSRGAVKDRSGNGFPIVRLTGYNKPAILQVFIGTDIGRVAPHMFYQACKVAGKNSTPCTEKKFEGTMIIEIEFKPETDMTVTCDCVGILKERNVDVEHRFPDHSGQRSKKKSTRCRMVFRTQLTHDDGSVETLQVCSHPIICTQPPGVPEICKKSLNSSPVEGGLELFIIGKNFLKDTRVVFQSGIEGSSNQTDINQMSPVWEETVFPDKEYLQQTHLICTVPPYPHQNIVEPVTVQFFVMSSGKKSETHNFVYTPKGAHSILSSSTTLGSLHGTLSNPQDSRYTESTANQSCPVMMWGSGVIEPKHEIDSGMMPPPTTLPLGVRRPSTSGTLLTDQMAQIGLKTEIMDESSQSSAPDTMQTDSLDQFPGSNDNSLDGTPIKIPFQRSRKQSVDIIDMRSISLINDTNSLPSFPTHAAHNHMSVVDLHVKQEQIASQLLSVAQNQQTVNKFLSALDELKTPVNAGPVNTLFVNPSNNTSSVVFSQQQINDMNAVGVNTNGNMESNFTQTLLSNANSQPSLTQILNIPQSDSPKSVHSPSSNSSSSTGMHSPLTQDIILNSEPAASINSANMQVMTTAANSPPEHITSELILNPTVSPSMMCTPSTDPNSLMNAQVTMANTILNDINMTQQQAQGNILNNMMMPPTTNPLHVAHNKTATETVNNMILKAAADFITNQEPSISTETTINALISLNSNQILNETQSQAVSQILNIPTSPQSTSSSSSLSPNEPQRLDIPMCQAQSTIPQHMTHYTDQNVMSNHQIVERRNLTTDNANSIANVPLGDLLLNQVSRSQDEFMQNLRKVTQIGSAVSSTESQESLLQAVSLKPKMNVAVQQMNIAQPTTLGQPSVTQPTTAASIPQDITTMSDQDLISYINPSCFDQV